MKRSFPLHRRDTNDDFKSGFLINLFLADTFINLAEVSLIDGYVRQQKFLL
jgi:hypothetical protein